MINPSPGNHSQSGHSNGVGHSQNGNGSHQGLVARGSSDRAQNSIYEPGSTSPKITPNFVLRSCRRWWKVALPVGLLLSISTGLVLALRYTPLYLASVWLRIEDESFIAYHERSGAQSRNFAQTQAQLIRSPLVMESVLVRPDIARLPYIIESVEPAAYLIGQTDVVARPDSELFIIQFTERDPQDAALLVNTIVEAYFKMHSQDEALRTQRVIELLEDERSRRNVLCKGLRDTIRDIKDKTMGGRRGDDEVMADQETLKLHMGQLQDKITALEVSYELRRAQLKAAEEFNAKSPPKVDPDLIEREAYNNPKVIDLREKVNVAKKSQRDIIAASAKGDQDPRVQQISLEVARLEKAMNDQMESVRDEVRLREIKKNEDARKEKLSAGYALQADAEMEIKLLRDKFFKQRKEGQTLGQENLDLVFKMQDLSREEATLDTITSRIYRLRTEMRAPARVTLLRSATPPSMPNSQFPLKQVTVFSFVSFCVPFVLAVFWEKIVCRVDGPQQLWQADLAVVGEVAKLPVSSRRITGNVGRDVSLFEESIDSLRTCLVLSEPGAKSRVLVVSSAVSGEGKTSVASQLAVSIARSSGEPTLLIDADMRSPDIHNVFDIPNEVGLAQVLGRECSVEDAIVTSWSNYVHIMPAGVLRASPHKLLGDGAIKAFLADVSSRYKHVIIDTSPILSASESLVLAKEADGTLLCAMRDISRVDQVQRAYERLLNTGARPLGTVLNGVPTNRYAYLYGVYAYSRD